MENKKIRILVLCIMFCSLIVTPTFAGEGLYPSKALSPVDTGTDTTSTITKDGKTYYWSELLGKYVPEDQYFTELDYPIADEQWEKRNLLPAPSRDRSASGAVNEDTLIFSGPSTPTHVFEDNGTISGGTELYIFHRKMDTILLKARKMAFGDICLLIW